MRITSPPDPIASDATRVTWRNCRYQRPPLPQLDTGGSPPNRDRNFGLRVPAFRADERVILQAFSLPISFCLLIHGLMQNWELVAFCVVLLTLNLLAAHYARREKAPHRFARVLTRVYFSTIRHPATGQAVRRHVRLPLLALLALLMFFSLRLRFPLGHDRPPLIDPRRLNNHSNWEYLRENHFFRPSPPPDPSP
jgi:hypothetical protein